MVYGTLSWSLSSTAVAPIKYISFSTVAASVAKSSTLFADYAKLL